MRFVNSVPTNSETSQLHQGSVAAVSLGVDVAPKLNSNKPLMERTIPTCLVQDPRRHAKTLGIRKLMLALAQTSVKVIALESTKIGSCITKGQPSGRGKRPLARSLLGRQSTFAHLRS